MLYILASGSPRRSELLNRLGLRPRVMPADVDETPLPDEEPRQMVKRLAMMKALHVAKAFAGKDALVIGADTCVHIDGRVLGKPKSADEAKEMLGLLAGRAHEVYTGYAAVRCADMETVAGSEETRVYMKALSDEEKTAYVNSGEPMDKAGAYGIQDKGSLLIEKIEGDYFNVVGLPVCALGKRLKKEFGITLL